MEIAGMPDHVGIGEITDDRIVLAAVDGHCQFIGHLDSAHLRHRAVEQADQKLCDFHNKSPLVN